MKLKIPIIFFVCLLFVTAAWRQLPLYFSGDPFGVVFYVVFCAGVLFYPAYAVVSGAEILIKRNQKHEIGKTVS